MGAGTAALVHRGAAWLCILLAFVGWVLVLAGVASLQQVGGKVPRHAAVPAVPAAAPAVPLRPHAPATADLLPVSVHCLVPNEASVQSPSPWPRPATAA